MFWFKKLTTVDILHTAEMPEVLYKYILQQEHAK